MWRTLKISSGAKLGHDKRDITAFDTCLISLKFKQLTTKILRSCSKKQNSVEFWAKNIKEE